MRQTLFALFAVSFLGCTTDPAPIDETKIEETLESEDTFENISCSELGEAWLEFQESTTLQFCYKEEWGELKFSKSEVAATGSSWDIIFRGGNSPHLSYFSPDFALSGDTDAPFIDYWTVLDFSLSEEELASQLDDLNPYEISPSEVQKVQIDSYSGVRSYETLRELSEDTVYLTVYYIPEVEIDGNTYNFRAYMYGEGSDLDLLMQTLKF